MKQFTLNKNIPEIYQANGINLTETLRRAGLPDDLFSRDSIRIDAEEYYRFVEATTLPIKTGECFVKLATENGLERVTPPVIGALCSQDIVSAIERMKFYADMFLPIRLITEETADTYRIELHSYSTEFNLPPAFGAMELLFLLNMFRQSTGNHIVPTEINLGIKEWPAVEDYVGTKPSYNKESTPHMVIRTEDAHAPFISANDDLWKILEPGLNIRLSQLKAGCSFADRVQGALLELIPSGRCKIEDVSARLHYSVRTIQRRLNEEGHKFQTILYETRKILNQGLDNIPYLKNTDRAYLLGFAHLDTYRRAMNS